MKFWILLLSAFCDGARNISDAEYQNCYSHVVDVSEIYSFDRFQFKNQVSHDKYWRSSLGSKLGVKSLGSI